MARTVSAALETEFDSLVRTPASTATVERWLPEWETKISGVGGPEYAHGHAAAATNDGTIIIRARSGNDASPTGGGLYLAVISGAALNTPEGWDTEWFYHNVGTVLPAPNWVQDGGGDRRLQGGSIDIAIWDDSGTPMARVFFFSRSGGDTNPTYLAYVDVNLNTSVAGSRVDIANLGSSDAHFNSLQLATCKCDEVFIARTEMVEDEIPGASWNAWEVWGTNIYRYHYTTSWQTDTSFHFHTHAEGGLLRDDPFQSDDFGAISWPDTADQWGKRFCGGLAAFNIDDDTAVIALGLTFWRRYGYNTHTQAIHSFICHRGTGWWERGFEAGNSDFEDLYRLDFDVFASGCNVAGSNFLVWSRFLEPSDYEQDSNLQALPRHSEAVCAKLSDDGKHLTQWQYLGPPETMTAAALVKANDKLYAIGWRSVYESPLATFVDETNDDQQDLELAISGWNAQRNNRWGMTVGLNVKDASRLFEPDTAFKSGSIVRVNFGTEAEQIQAAQGYLDMSSPAISLAGRSHKTKFGARADKPLMDTAAEAMDDILPQETKYIPPTDPIKHVSKHAGYWALAKGTWDSTFFSNAYGMASMPVYRLYSFPYAYTGGAGGHGDPGRILNERPQHKGSWWKDVVWLAHTPMVDGMVQSSVRFGDINNGGNFNFVAADGNRVYQTISRSNGLISEIQWRTSSYSGPIWNYVDQAACMAGVICHAPQLGKKYAFVWEADTSSDENYNSNDKVPPSWIGYPKPFSASSHTDDTWKAENMDRCDFRSVTLGANRLYLVVSDYNDTNDNWLANGQWVHVARLNGVVTGLTPGRPADLRMQVLGGTIYCYYRLYSNGTPNQWRLAFDPYNAGRFGAGRFGIIGRGHAGIQWDVLYPGKSKIIKYDNYVDFWNVHLSDGVIDRPMEEIIRKRVWQGFTPTEFRSKESEASRTVNAGTTHFYQDSPVENLTIDFKLDIPASGNEAGVFLRGVDFATPTNQCVRLGIVAHSTLNANGSTVNYYVVKRYYLGGAEQTSYREYTPIPIRFSPGVSIPVRITSRGRIYTVWVAGNYCGHFRDDTELGVWWGLYATGGNATFYDVHVPELYEVPAFSTVEVNQKFGDAAKQIIGQRPIKGVYTHNGVLKLSCFDTHEDGGSFEDRLKQSTLQMSDRFASVVRVDGAWTHAQYSSPVMLEKGRRYMQASMPDVYHREFCYAAAKRILTEIAERMVQGTFVGSVDLRVESEDEIEITVAQQDTLGNYLVDDVAITFEMAPKPEGCKADMVISTRQKVVL